MRPKLSHARENEEFDGILQTSLGFYSSHSKEMRVSTFTCQDTGPGHQTVLYKSAMFCNTTGSKHMVSSSSPGLSPDLSPCLTLTVSPNLAPGLTLDLSP